MADVAAVKGAPFFQQEGHRAVKVEPLSGGLQVRQRPLLV